MVGPTAKRKEAEHLLETYSVSKSRVCQVLGLNRSTLNYKPHPRSDEPVASKLIDLATEHRRFGHPRLFVLLQREGIMCNHKRSERIYQGLGLQVKRRKRKKLGAVGRVPLDDSRYPGHVWSIDFMYDRLESGRQVKVLTVVDEFTKVSPSILVNHSITGLDVAGFLQTACGRLPKVIKVDQGTEFTSRALLDWAYRQNIELQFTRVRKPNQVIEAFNSRVRDEVLNEHVFFSLADARSKIDDWHERYNNFNPHSSIGMKTPTEFAKDLEAMLNA